MPYILRLFNRHLPQANFQMIEGFSRYCSYTNIWFNYAMVRGHSVYFLSVEVHLDFFMAQRIIYYSECFMCNWKEGVFCIVGYHVPSMSIRWNWLIVLFLLIFCLLTLSVIERSTLKSFTITVDLFIFLDLSFCSKLEALFLGGYISGLLHVPDELVALL